METILQRHYRLYPQLQIEDMVKLIFQSEFAGGHFFPNEEESMMQLAREFHGIEKDDLGTPLCEDIGNGLCRLHLAALKGQDIKLATINRFVLNTAASVHGNIAGLERRLESLRQCCEDGSLPWALTEVDAYLKRYREQQYPPVHHSEVYRQAYAPAYRIAQSQYGDFFDLFVRIDALMRGQPTVHVAIDGNSAAGKTTLANLVSSVYDCNTFHMDHFFLPPGLRTKERCRETGGNVDYERFQREVMGGLESKGRFQYRIYNCQTNTFIESVTVDPKALNIIEGAYSMHPTFRDRYDLTVFLAIDPQRQRQRILARNGLAMYRRFVEEWIPLENRYFDAMKVREQSDLVFWG